MEIRKLKTKDVFTVIGMLKKIGNTNLSKLFISDTTSSKKESKPDVNQSVSLGMSVLSELYDHMITDLQNWFASLISVTIDEYMEMPPETTLEIIEALVYGEESKGFFSRALQLYKKMTKSGDTSKSK